MLQGTVNGNRKEIDRRGGKHNIKEWAMLDLSAQLGQLETGQDEKGLLRRHLWDPNDLTRLWERLDWTRNSDVATMWSHHHCTCSKKLTLFSNFIKLHMSSWSSARAGRKMKPPSPLPTHTPHTQHPLPDPGSQGNTTRFSMTKHGFLTYVLPRL